MKKTAYSVVIAAIAAVLGAGIYKFSIAQDEVFLRPEPMAIAGAWLEEEPLPGSDAHMGFELLADGSALAINSATLLYRNWSLDGDRLSLVVQSIGNGQSSEETVVYQVHSLTLDAGEMTLTGSDGRSTAYRRENPAMTGSNTRFPPEKL